MLVALLFFSALLPLTLGNDVPVVNCDRIPPLFWCKSKEIAQKCGVVDQCTKYEEGSSKQKLLITVLYESFCPGCQNFITGHLYDDVYTKFGKYVDIELVPYGNAKMSGVSQLNELKL